MSTRRRITTLKDVFPDIKREYKRNFLLENKVKIRDIQHTVKTKKDEEEERNLESLKRKQILKERLARVSSRISTFNKKNSEISALRRSKSTNPLTFVGNAKTHECTCGANLRSNPMSAKSTTSIDREIQTDFNLEDIESERRSAKSMQDVNLDIQTNNEDNTERTRGGKNEEEQIDVQALAREIEEESRFHLYTNRSNGSLDQRDQRLMSAANPLSYKDQINYLKPHHDVPKTENLSENLERLKIDDANSIDLEKKKSARSITSISSNRSDLKLPKYLEKEKREKELQRLQKLEIDPDCPIGYRLLDNNERIQTLESLKKEYQSLVDELNYLPITSVTLRVRNRKTEIEKELVILESKIRFYEKQKIYIKYSPHEINV